MPLLEHACAAPGKESRAKKTKIRVAGTVVSISGEPIRKANVHLQGGSSQPGQLPFNYGESTATNGTFVFDDVAPGRYMLTVEKTGFVATRYGARSNATPGTQFTLTAGMELKDLTLKMTPQGVITGKVLDQDGDPVTTATLQVLRYAYTRGRRHAANRAAATNVNDLGEYRVRRFYTPGRYYISAIVHCNTSVAQHRSGPGRAGEVQEGAVTTYYPNGADVSGAAAIDVTAGSETRGIDIHLLRAKVYTVRGKAVAESAIPPTTIMSFSRKDDVSELCPANDKWKPRPIAAGWNL